MSVRVVGRRRTGDPGDSEGTGLSGGEVRLRDIESSTDANVTDELLVSTLRWCGLSDHRTVSTEEDLTWRGPPA
jgi:hypothetical protein